MHALELLKAIAQASQAVSAEAELPSGVVRFTLEYASKPDLGAQQDRLERLIGSKAPALFALDPDLDRFLVLQFSDIARTVSAPSLFEVADLLARELELISCTPDTAVVGLEAPVSDDLASESAVADPIMQLTCLTHNPKPNDPFWAAASVRADKVWDRTRGAGVVIAQPDTGVADHQAINAGLDISKAFNVMTNKPGAVDPLKKGSGNPGHGTATSSVVIGNANGIRGVAPEAKVVPIRAIESVVVFDGAPIARAIMYAIRIGAHVITMSLGGLFISPALKAALAKAVENGVIISAAAGNCVQPIVVYPASDRSVLAIGGVGEHDKPWRGSSRGQKVAFSAPAENVFVARRAPDDGGEATRIEPGEGTSFATAAVAGVAALWLAFHGRQNVIDEAAGRQISVQRLFSLAATNFARIPSSNWDGRYGAGVLNAEVLVATKLSDIPQTMPALEGLDAANDEQTAALIEVMALAAEPEADPGFDWARFGPEAVFLAADAWRRTRADQAVFVESARKPKPSPGLSATGLPPALERALAPLADQPSIQPPLVREQEDLPLAAPGVIRSRTAAQGPAVMSEATRSRVLGGEARSLLTKLDQRFAQINSDDPDRSTLRKRTLESAERGIARVQAGKHADLEFEDVVALEALVRLTGRPAYRVEGGAIRPELDLDGWGATLSLFPVAELAASVGRIDIDGAHAGTGSVVAPQVIMTNRHVLEGIAEEIQGPGGSTWLFSLGEPSIDFSDRADGSMRFKIKKVLAAGSTPTCGRVRFTNLDMALLEVEPVNGQGQPLPKNLRLVDQRDPTAQRVDIVTMGYPARPSADAMMDPKTNRFRPDIQARLQEIFGLRYGQKYLSPGQVSLVRGKPTGDARRWVFAHDATTLGGNSGSVVTALSDQIAIGGLHFGGAPLVNNYAHSLSAVRGSGLLKAIDQIGADWI